MDYRNLGRSGVHVSSLSLGAMMFGRGGNPDAAECEQMIHRALDMGVNLIDTADGYSRGESEQIVGRALTAGSRRDATIVATKCFFPAGSDPNSRGGSRRWIIQACERSLRRLGTEYIDLYQLHRFDPATALDESLGAMDDLVRAGKVRMVGHSGAAAHQVVHAQWVAEQARVTSPVCEQAQYSILTREVETAVLPACLRHGLGAIVYGPLNGGWLTGKYRRGTTPDPQSRAGRRFFSSTWWDMERDEIAAKFDVLDELEVLARDLELSLSHLALGFVLAHQAVSSAIIGPRTMAQLDDLLEGAHVRLDDATLDTIDALVAPGTDVDRTNFVEINPDLSDPSRRRRTG